MMVIWKDKFGSNLKEGDTVVELSETGAEISVLKSIRPFSSPIVHSDGRKEFTDLEGDSQQHKEPRVVKTVLVIKK